MQQFPTLYSRTSTGAIQQWVIEVDGPRYRTISGQVDGQKVEKKWTECKPKNVGRSNETTAEEQCLLEARAKWDKKIKENYFEDVTKIDSSDFKEPQLATATKGTTLIEDIDWSEGWYVDEKLNGTSCVVKGKDVAISRTNERYYAIPHILKELSFLYDYFPKAYIQGELFNPLYVNDLGKLTELISVVRQEKDITPELLAESEKIVQFHVYDGYNFNGTTIDTVATERREKLAEFISRNDFKYVKIVNYKRCFSREVADKFHDSYVASGGEGTILRNPNSKYKHGRSKGLLKRKKLESAEFKIISIEEGDGDWKGCAKAAWCEAPKGKREKKFKTNVSGTIEHCRKIYDTKERYIGKYVTVEFQELSPYNIPLIPYSDLIVRDYE